MPRSAEDILRELSILRPQDIDLEAIAWLQGAKVKYRKLDGCEACIRGDAKLGRAIISVEEGAYERRQRFSLAHEIGHWEWHRGQILHCQKEHIGGSGRRQGGLSRERSANRFAAELLMPSFMLREALRAFSKFDMYVVGQLADAFAVSKTAMAYRLIEMDDHQGFLVSHTKAGRQWFVRSRSMGHRWVPTNMLDQRSGAYDILYNGAENDRFMSIVEGDIWFDVPWASEIEIREQAFRVSEDEVMTLIVAKDERMLAD